MKVKFSLLLLLGLLIGNSFSQINLTSTNLPIIVINTNGKSIPDEPKITATMGVIDNGTGVRNSITDKYNSYSGKIGIEVRGHSSQMFPKKQYSIELRNTAGSDTSVSLLGMPAESDWILNANYTDKTLLRNVLAYKIGNDLGRYASRTRFCELILNNEYMGIYILQEKIKRDKNRVNITKMAPTDISGDAVTGGYILHIDRIDSGDKFFVSKYASVYPKTPSIPSPINYILNTPNENDLQPAQLSYISNFIEKFETLLTKTTYNDPFDGYYDIIDIDALVDYFLASEFTKATDAYRLSTFLYKDRDSKNGKLVFGPMWDYDLSFGLADYGQGWLTSGWIAQLNPWEGEVSPPFWIKKLFADPIIFNKIAKRWHSIKNDAFYPLPVIKFLEDEALYLVEARNRNFEKWRDLFDPAVYIWPNKNRFTNYNDELLYLKNWIWQRYNWMDANLPLDYSDIEWKQPGTRWLIYQPGKTITLPLSLFYSSYKNVTGLGFVCKDMSITFSISSDSLFIQSTKLGEFTFKAVARKGSSVVSISPEYKINLATSISDEGELPTETKLEQNFPNPFNPETTISYKVHAASHVRLKVYDMLGREIVTLVDEIKQPGVYHSTFSTQHSTLTTGIYFYTLTAGDYSETRKMLLIK